MFFLLYVDDMIITGDDLSGIIELKQYLSSNFEIKDLGHLAYFIGLEVCSAASGYYLSQIKYATDLLYRAGIIDSKIASSFEINVRLTSTDGNPLDDATLYRQLVGSLVYLTITCPNITYEVHVVGQVMTTLHTTHYTIVLRILYYVRGTLFCGIYTLSSSSLELCAYFDAD